MTDPQAITKGLSETTGSVVVDSVAANGICVNASFQWVFPDGWILAGCFGQDYLRQMPSITLYLMQKSKDGSSFIPNTCDERLTLWSSRFQETLKQLVISVDEKRDENLAREQRDRK